MAGDGAFRVAWLVVACTSFLVCGRRVMPATAVLSVDVEKGIRCVGDGGKHGWVDKFFWCNERQKKENPEALECEADNKNLSYANRAARDLPRCRRSWTSAYTPYCKCGSGYRWCFNNGLDPVAGRCSACNPSGTAKIAQDGSCMCKSGFPGNACGCTRDDSCPSGQVCGESGKCMTPCEKWNIEHPNELPKIRCYSSKEELMSDTWCQPLPYSNELQLPMKLQGFFWMRHVTLAEVGFCTSLGRWSSEKFGSLELGDGQWVYHDNLKGWDLGRKSYNMRHVKYLLELTDEAQNHAEITFTGGAKAFAANLALDITCAKLPLEEISGGTGERWSRPTYFGWSTCGAIPERSSNETAQEHHEDEGAKNYYEAWKLYYIDPARRDTQVFVDRNVHAFKTDPDEKSQVTHFFRHLAEWEHTGKTLDNRGWEVK